MGFWRSGEEKRQAAAEQARIEGLIGGLAQIPANSAEIARAVSDAGSVVSSKERNRLAGQWVAARDRVLRDYTDQALADDHLTVQEELELTHLIETLAFPDDALATTHRDVLFRLVVARANDGRLSEIEAPKLIAKGDEVVYLETYANLMKEVAIREWQGRSNGMSFRVAKGVRYHVGQTRGQSVVVGTRIEVADTGVLSVTSTRAAFLGSKKTIEFPFAKLMSFEVFSDGIRFHSSNRQTTPLFQLESGDVVAATLNTAMQRFEERPPTRTIRTRRAADS